MTPAFSARRRADEFEALVSGDRAPESLGERDASRLAGLLELVSQMRAVPPVAPRPEFVSDLRERLMAEADTLLVPASPDEDRLRLPAPGTRRERRLATVIGGAAVIGATTSMAVAAQTALPGDSLYPVKRALESAEARLADGQGEKGEALLANAADRLAEVDALAHRGTPEGIAAVPDTLDAFTAQSTAAADLLLSSYEDTGDESVILELRDFTLQSMQTLMGLEAAVPDSARDELVAAAENLAAIDDRTRVLCPSCPGAGITAIPSVLLSAGIVPSDAVPPVPSAEAPLVPASPQSDRTGEAPDGTIELPDLEGAVNPDGGATGDDSGADNTPDQQPTQDPVTELTHVLTGNGGGGKDDKGAGTSTNTSTDPVTDVLEGLGQAVDDVEEATGDLLD